MPCSSVQSGVRSTLSVSPRSSKRSERSKQFDNLKDDGGRTGKARPQGVGKALNALNALNAARSLWQTGWLRCHALNGLSRCAHGRLVEGRPLARWAGALPPFSEQFGASAARFARSIATRDAKRALCGRRAVPRLPASGACPARRGRPAVASRPSTAAAGFFPR